MLSTKSQAIEIMDRAMLEGRRPLPFRGFVSMAEMGASLFIAKSIVSHHVNWSESTPDILIFSLLGFLGGVLGKLAFCRGVPINFFLPSVSMSFVQLYHGQEMTPVSNCLSGMLFSGVHSILYEKISQPYVIGKLRLPVLTAYQSGNLLKARAMHFGLLRGGVWMVGFVSSTALLTLFEWLGERRTT